MSDEKTTEEKGFEEQPEHEFVPGLDELALRLQVPPQEEPFTGVILFGKSGKAYSMTQILAHHMQFTTEGIELAANIYQEVKNMQQAGKEEGEKNESNKGAGQSKKANNTSRNSKSNKS